MRGIDRDQCGLRRAGLPLALRQQLVHLRQAVAHRVLREALQVQVERRVDVEALGTLDQCREPLGQLLADHVDEVRRLGLERARHDRRAARAAADSAASGRRTRPRPSPAARRCAGPWPASGAVNGDRLEGDWMTPAIVAASASDQVGDVLAEEQLRALGHAVDRERPALAEVHLVQVQLEDLVLRGPPFEHHRHELLGDLAALRPARQCRQLAPRRSSVRDDPGQEDVLDQLLRDRAAADQVRPVAEDVGRRARPTMRMGSTPGWS